MNPYQAAMQGEEMSLQSQAQRQEQDLRAQQIQREQTTNELGAIQLHEAEQAQRDQELLGPAYLNAHGDMDQFFKNATAAGVRPQTIMGLQKQWTDQAKAYADLGSVNADLLTKHNNALLGSLRQFSTGTDTAGNPVYRNITGDEASSFLDNAVQNGYLSKDHAAQIQQQFQNGATAADLQHFGSALRTDTQALAAGRDIALTNEATERARQEAMATDERLRGQAAQYSQFVTDQDSLDQFRKDLKDKGASSSLLNSVPQTFDPQTWNRYAQQLAVPVTAQPDWVKKKVGDAADQLRVATTVGDYEQRRANLGGLADRFPDFSKLDPNTPLSSEQKSAIDDAAFTPEERVRNRQSEALMSMYGQRGQLYGAQAGMYNMHGQLYGAQSNLDNARAANGGQTPNSTAVDKRQALNQFYKKEIEERKLNNLRQQLGPLLAREKKGETINDKAGNARNIQEEFNQATDQLAETLSDKYDAAHRAGMGEPKVSLGDALKAIGRGSAAPAQPTPQPTQQQNSPSSSVLPDGGGKALDRATGERFYQAAGGDPVKARELARQHHWTF